MSKSGSIQLDWADGKHVFRLGLAQLEELEDIRGAGTGAICKRCSQGDWFAGDVREIIRLGLIGGGMSPAKAKKMVGRYVDQQPWGENSLLANAILWAAVTGPPIEDEDDQQEIEGDDENPSLAKGIEGDNCPSPVSMPTAS
jgi:hypothetical protein